MTVPVNLNPMKLKRAYSAYDYYLLLHRLFPKGIIWNFQHEFTPDLYMSGIESEEVLGIVNIDTSNIDISINGIDSLEELGELDINLEMLIDGIDSEESIGVLILAIDDSFYPNGIESLEAFGDLGLTNQYGTWLIDDYANGDSHDTWWDDDFKNDWPIQTINGVLTSASESQDSYLFFGNKVTGDFLFTFTVQLTEPGTGNTSFICYLRDASDNQIAMLRWYQSKTTWIDGQDNYSAPCSQMVRIRRSGSNITCELSNDNGETWEDSTTWDTPASTGICVYNGALDIILDGTTSNKGFSKICLAADAGLPYPE